MVYGILINLDYVNHPYDVVHDLFAAIQAEMFERGFRQDGRVFTIECTEAEATALAREAVEAVERERPGGPGPYQCIKEFLGFDYGNACNLLVPAGDIMVEELDEEDIAAVAELGFGEGSPQ